MKRIKTIAGVLAAVIVLGVLWFFFNPARRSDSLVKSGRAALAQRDYVKAARALNAAVGAARLAGDDSTQMHEALAAQAQLLNAQEKSEEAARVAADAVAKIEKKDGRDAARLVVPLTELGIAKTALLQPDDAETAFFRARQIAEKQTPPDLVQLGKIADNLGMLYALNSRYEDAASTYERMAMTLDQNKAPTLDGICRYFCLQATALIAAAHTSQAVTISARILTTYKQVHDLNPDPDPDLLEALEAYYEATGKYLESVELWPNIIKSINSHAPVDRRRLAQAQLKQALSELVMGRYADAITHADEGMALQRTVLPEKHPELALGLLVQARVLEIQGKYADARKAAENGLALAKPGLMKRDLLEALLSLDINENQMVAAVKRLEAIRILRTTPYPRTMAGLLNDAFTAARLQLAAGNAAAALQSAQAATDAAQTMLSEMNADVLMARIRLGGLYADAGNPAKAADNFSKSLPVLQRVLTKDNPALGTTLARVAALLVLQNNVGAAEEYRKRLIKIAAQQQAPDLPELAMGCARLGQLYAAKGHLTEATELITQAKAIVQKVLPASDARRIAIDKMP